MARSIWTGSRLPLAARLGRPTTVTRPDRSNAFFERMALTIPPYDMSAAQLKRSIRDRHKVTQHDEFPGNVIHKNNASLIEA
tara:strand:- start:1299 stop:1544 length:246 start_codon:yes stop_codon:yes gene_type:complete